MNKIGREIRDEEMTPAERKEKELLLAFEENGKAADNPNIREKYRGKFVAILEGKVIEADKKFNRLLRKLKAKIKRYPEMYIGYIPRRGERICRLEVIAN